MSSIYDALIAKHYAAYRPTLHRLILEKSIENKTYAFGLDVGCGTGNSAIALSFFCNNVIGIDPSKSMIEKAETHSKVSYQHFNGKNLNFKANTFDISTFAGSLFYAKSQFLLDEIIHISKDKAQIIVYDFEILLDDILQQFNFVTPKNETYNHQADFSGLRANAISIIKEEKEIVPFQITPEDLAHLLLSTKSQQQFFIKLFKKDNPHQDLRNKLKSISNNNDFKINARIFYKVYTVTKSIIEDINKFKS
ncbi:class I SAM-dependent methyltransferase [Aurantibacter crassamenti]|uniref:class I SAM-dependent methyltransferase n=1 Tax=Aurantibacter crassamenti TaxID=1837375 RepID=UPI00193A2ED8|nr:class I SAM-dependent methyltransferase [Aurantibacter crassamenti]MBM1106344.1 class I SAM-dependent methyltransferase [Aurantibacter crassamenti]